MGIKFLTLNTSFKIGIHQNITIAEYNRFYRAQWDKNNATQQDTRAREKRVKFLNAAEQF